MKTTFKTVEQLIQEGNTFIDAIPNNLGINLCNVSGIEFKTQEDGQFSAMKILFLPDPIEEQDMERQFFGFGTAIEHLKLGKKVARKGWNGKGMYLKLIQGYPVNGHIQPSDPHALIPAFNPDGTPNITQGASGKMLSHIVMKTAGASQYWGEGFSDYVPWLASKTDVLSDDWEIVE